MTVVTIPYRPRSAFEPLHNRKMRWSIVVAHRRAGKTVACINELIKSALSSAKPQARCAYVAPYFSQAKDVAWVYLKQFSSVVPGVQFNESELRVDFPNGSRVRLYGADNYERLRGIYLDAVILDEYGDMDPRAWQEVIRASLADREGWAVFIGTPKGLNHFSDQWEKAQSDADWFHLKLRASESGILPQRELDDARKEMTEDQYDAEFECSFDASVIGSYYGREMAKAEAEGRITGVPHYDGVLVDTWWDLGVSDAMVLWFTQNVGREVHVIDYYEQSGEGLPHYVKIMNDKGYLYGTHNAPHDIEVREMGSGKSRLEVARGLGVNFSVVPNIGLMDGIDAARLFIGRCWFDRVKTDRGRMALRSYQKTWDEKRKIFSSTPLHNWASHGSDGFRYLAVGHKTAKPLRERTQHRPVQQGSGGQRWLAT